MRLGLCVVLSLLFAALAASCSAPSSSPPDNTDHPADTTIHDTTVVQDSTRSTDNAAIAHYGPVPFDSSQFYGRYDCGQVDTTLLPEVSGLASSRRYPGMFWTHNDSGNPNDIFLIDSAAKVRAIVQIENLTNRDWEDIAVGPGPDANTSYIYLADIGDNDSKHATSAIYRFAEPDIPLDTAVIRTGVSGLETITFRYADGPHDAEAVMLDPLTRDLYVATKGFVSYVYRLTYPQSVDTTTVLRRVAQIPLPLITAADISNDGSEMLLKTYGQILYWQRGSGETVIGALMRTPVMVPYSTEAQGEALSWIGSGYPGSRSSAYYTLSEKNPGVPPHLWRYSRR